jgi:NACHT domain
MERDFYFPLTLGIRSPSQRIRTRQAARGRTRERSYETWSESVDRQDVSYTPFPEAQVLSALVQDSSTGGKLWIVLGEPGAGKSTLFTQWYCRWLSRLKVPRIGMAVPVLVSLGELSRTTFTLDSAALADHLWKAGLESRARLGAEFPRFYTPDTLHLLTPVWLLDGLDEIDREYPTAGWVARLVNLPGAKALSCRTALFEDWRDAVTHYQAREYEVLALQSDEQATFLREVAHDTAVADTLHNALQGNPQLRRLAGSPLLLRLIAKVCDSGELPYTRSDFYANAVTWMWHRNLINFLSTPEYDRITTYRDDTLTALAGALGLQRVTETLGFLKDVTRRVCEDSTHVVTACLDRSGILKVERSRNSFGFLHLTFHEYFLAQSLRAEGLAAALGRYWDKPRYEETLALLVSLLVNLGEDAVVEAALCDFIDFWQTAHSDDPEAMWEIGRSPLRVALHVLARAGEDVVARGSRLERKLLDAVAVSLERKIAVASDYRMPRWILEKLAHDPDAKVRSRVVENRSSRSLMGEQLDNNPAAQPPHPRAEVNRVEEGDSSGASYEYLPLRPEHLNDSARVAMARNPSTPADVLVELAEKYPDLRREVAGNPSAPIDLITRLALDESHVVRGRVAHAPAVSTDILQMLAGDESDFVRGRVAENPRTSEDVLVQLAGDKDVEVRKKVAANPSTLARTLAELLSDEEVRSDAVRNPGILLEDL